MNCTKASRTIHKRNQPFQQKHRRWLVQRSTHASSAPFPIFARKIERNKRQTSIRAAKHGNIAALDLGSSILLCSVEQPGLPQLSHLPRAEPFQWQVRRVWEHQTRRRGVGANGVAATEQDLRIVSVPEMWRTESLGRLSCGLTGSDFQVVCQACGSPSWTLSHKALADSADWNALAWPWDSCNREPDESNREPN